MDNGEIVEVLRYMNKQKKGMQFISAAGYEELSRISAGIMIECIKQKPDALLCLATGNSPALAYDIFVEQVKKERINVRELRILKLDEWCGVPGTDPSTCESFIQENIIEPMNIKPEKYISFDSAASDADAECNRISQRIAEEGPIDLCILGLGRNGHLGLNEPACSLVPFAHAIRLEAETRMHSMLAKTDAAVEYGMTIGMAEIMASSKVLLMAAGEGKDTIFNEFSKACIRCDLPASFLWLHPDTICVYESRLPNHIQY